MSTYPARHVSVAIERGPEAVYAMLADPARFPLWASGLGETFRHVEGLDWSVETPAGRMLVRFSTPNAFGIADHWVIPPEGAAIYSPMRVLANGDGSEVVFTLFHRPEMSDEEFERDAEWVAKDFRVLKRLLEEGA